MTLTVTDFFGGGGGASEGLRQAGCRIVAAANHWDIAVATHQLNHPDTEHHLANLIDCDMRRFPSTDIGWFSPSCVWHSPAGGRKKLSREEELKRTDPGAIDRATAFAVIAAAEVHQYEAIVVENVPEFCSWVLFDWWCDGLRALGYRMQGAFLNAFDFGVPQHRKRWFGVFTRDGNVDLSVPSIPRRYATDILDPDPGKPVTRRLYVTPQIEQIETDDVHLVTYRKHAKARRADQYPLATIAAGGNHHAIAMVVNGEAWHRLLVDRECARAQGFPDTYRFLSRRENPKPMDTDIKRQIGGAVAVPVARFLGERVTAAIEFRQVAA